MARRLPELRPEPGQRATRPAGQSRLGRGVAETRRGRLAPVSGGSLPGCGAHACRGGLQDGVAGAGDSRPLTQAFLGAVIPGRDEMHETEASPQMLALAREHGGFLLIVTQAADPARLDADALTCALASPMTVTGWARLGHDSGLT